MVQISASRSVRAPADVVWGVITDHRLYGEVAPNLAAVEVVRGSGEGMVRRCVDTDGNAWTETCTRWDDGRAFRVSVDVERSEFHRRLFDRFEGEWGLTEHLAGVVITIQFDADPKYGPLGWVISRYVEWKAPPLLEAILDRWGETIRARAAGRGQTNGPAATE